MNLLETAIAIAAKAHTGQVDRGGRPYILHPLRVALSLSDYEDQVVAVLHDVVEDTSITLDELRLFHSIDPVMLGTLDLLTHQKDVPYFDYIKDLRTDERAVRVKIADLEDNMNLDRLSTITAKDLQRNQKYHQAFDLLTQENYKIGNV